jgi:hypothetical protein
MLRQVDRILVRVVNLPAAARHYRDALKLELVRQDKRVAIFKLAGGGGDTELVLHDDPDLPNEATYFLVDDVRDLYRRRREMRLTFAGPPQQASRGYRATVKDGFGVVMNLIDRTTGTSAAADAEDARPAAGGLFAGVTPRAAVRRDRLIETYVKINRTADDLPYTPHFESLYEQYVAGAPDPKPDRAEVWRHLLTIRKSGKLPKVGEARSKPPAVEPEQRQRLKDILGKDLGKRDRLPYTERFERIVDGFNRGLPRAMSPHHVWRLVATLAK